MAAKVYGLVLAGGKSSRMGKDKGKIDYYGMPQREYLYGLLQEICEDVYLSVRKDQVEEIDHFNSIADNDLFPGPFNGILSAHDRYPGLSWLVVATDLPFLRLEDLQQLLKARNPGKVATAFASRTDRKPEPLCCIWEPDGLKAARNLVRAGSNSPRNFLVSAGAKLVYPENDIRLTNTNTPQDSELVLKALRRI